MNKNITLSIIIVIIIIAGIWYIKAHPSYQNQNSANNFLASVTYSCDSGKTIDASLYSPVQTSPSPTVVPGEPPHPNGTAHIVMSDGRTLDLAQTLSADGARYANQDESFVFWTKGNGALVLENGKEANYKGCIAVAPQPEGVNLPAIYSNATKGFSVRLPSLAAGTSSAGYRVNDSYSYEANGPTHTIPGVKFTIPISLSQGTNLSDDSYISVEQMPGNTTCNATNFLGQSNGKNQSVTEGDITYSVASSSEAAAGNRYDEVVYAIPGTNPCVAVRYFIHYGVFQNYPAGSIKEFDEHALLDQFDQIRRTLLLNQQPA